MSERVANKVNNTNGKIGVIFGFLEKDGFRVSMAKGCRYYKTAAGADRAIKTWIETGK